LLYIYYISPYSIIYDTDEILFNESNIFDVNSFDKQRIKQLISKNLLKERLHTCLSGGILGMSNKAVKQISGWDERFRGRGWEDYAMTSKINLFINKIHVFDIVAIHLWHPTMDLNCDKENNRCLNMEYGNYNLDNYIEHIIESQTHIGCKNKYNKIYNICNHCIPNKKKLINITDFSSECIKIFEKTCNIVCKYHKKNKLFYVYNTLCEQHYCSNEITHVHDDDVTCSEYNNNTS
jgi:predicted glycosyltransferase involved in capsule biosynthesis